MDEDMKKIDLHEWMQKLEEEWNKLSPEEQEARIAEAKAEQERLSKMSIEEIMNEAQQELAKSLGKPGWTYRDLPRMIPEVRDNIVQIIGEDQIYWITQAEYKDGSVRGQILISPLGMKALEMYSTGSRQ